MDEHGDGGVNNSAVFGKVLFARLDLSQGVGNNLFYFAMQGHIVAIIQSVSQVDFSLQHREAINVA